MTAINDLFTAGQYFLTITAELILLFIGISFLVGLIQEYVPEDKIRRTLTTKHRVTGTALGAVFGALTPFCSCSTIPILLGLIKSKVPFGACMAFLFASPLLNPIIVFLVLAFFGLVPAVIYFILTFCIAVLSGLFLERRDYLRYVKPIATSRDNHEGISTGCCPANAAPVAPTACCSGLPAPAQVQAASGCSCGSEPVPAPVTGCCSKDSAAPSVHRTRMGSALGFALTLFRQVVPYLILGAAIGAFIYGFVPEDLIVALAGPENPLAIPIAAVIGIPMYIRAETIIPISGVLVTKGMGIGAVMALIIGGAGASIPEVTLLTSIFERKLVAAFVVTIVGVAIITGGLFQVLQVMGMFA
ncbi:MAG TPA: permease [Methanolinea sp.]|nr:permease [Methanolinea sp.]